MVAMLPVRFFPPPPLALFEVFHLSLNHHPRSMPSAARLSTGTLSLPLAGRTVLEGAAMAYTQSHLDALQEALASGTLTVTFEGRSMTYRSVQELQRAISVVQSSLNQQSGKRVRQYQLSGSKGI